MYPILYKSNETNFTHNGLGLLSDAISAVATEELNGMFELKIEYDSEGFLVDEIKEEMIIKAKANDKQDGQLFRIYSITKNHENDNLIIDAQHITYDLANDFVEEMIADNLTKRQVMEKILASSVGNSKQRFTMTSPNTTTRSSTSLYRTNPLQMVAGTQGSILQIWGGQIERDNFRLVLHDRRGHDDGVLVTYKKNLTGLDVVFDISDVITRIYPFVFKEEESKLITLTGNYVDSPLITDYEQVFIQPIDYSSDERIDRDGTDAQIRQQLTNLANVYFNETGNDKPKVSMKVKFEHLWETEEYKHLAVLELVGMGDTVTIEHSKLKVFAKAIVNRIEYDCIARKNIAVDVGNVKARLTDTVNKASDIADNIDGKIREVSEKATKAIESANGKSTNFYGPDEPENATKDDLWFKVVDGEYTQTYRFDGIQWQLVVDMDTALAKEQSQKAIEDANEAYERAEDARSQANKAIENAQTAFDEAKSAHSAADTAHNLAQTTSNLLDTVSNVVDGHTAEIKDTKEELGRKMSRVDADAKYATQSELSQTADRFEQNISDIQYEFDNLQIDGRNLIVDSLNYNLFRPYSSSSQTLQYDVSVPEWGATDAVRFIITDGGSVIKSFRSLITDAPEMSGITYTMSVYIKNNNDKDVIIHTNRIGGKVVEANSSIRLIITGSSTSNAHMQIQIRTSSTSDNVDITMWNPKLEKGNKATDWSPAPEDLVTEVKFSSLVQTVDDMTTIVAKKVDQTVYDTFARQTTESFNQTVSKTEYNDNNDIIDNRFTSVTQTIDGIQTEVLNPDGSSKITRLADVIDSKVTKQQTDSWYATQTQLQQTSDSFMTKISNIEIGGRNLYTRSSADEGWGIYLSTRTLVDKNHSVPEWETSDALRLVYSNGTSSIVGTRSFLTRNNPLYNEGDEYIATGYIKNNSLNSGLRISSNGNGGENIIVNPNSATFFTLRMKLNGNANLQLNLSTLTTGVTLDVSLWRIMVTKGNKATDWTPAIEDTQSQISQLIDNINLRVQKGDFINQINISDESILIDGKKLHITAQAKIDRAVIQDANIKELDAGKVTFGTLDGLLATIININASNINTGSIDTKFVSINNDQITIDHRGIRIIRPDGAVYMQNGMVKSEHAVSAYDPPLMNVMKDGSGRSMTWAFDRVVHDEAFLEGSFGRLDGRGISNLPDTFSNVRDPDFRWSVRYQRYRFIHSARYLKFAYQIANNRLVGKHRIDFFEVGSNPSGTNNINTSATYEKGDYGTKVVTIDLGRPSYTNRTFDFRIGWNLSWNDKDEIVRFRIPYIYQTDN